MRSRVLRRLPEGDATGGIVLVAAAGVALLWANSPWSSAYRTLVGTDLSVTIGRFAVDVDLQQAVNDGLMAIFFLVVGLEIKRELVRGELRDPRKAALPAIAALGGMVVPALVFSLLVAGGPGARGWGVPMATDIAFALAVLAVVGPRVPASLRLFLLTLAIVDDIGAVVVIAVFYAEDVEPVFLAVAIFLLGVMVVLRRRGDVPPAAYVVVGIAVWLATAASGVHATIAGVALGLLTPARTADSPAERLEHLLRPWTGFVVLPLFALANAGVAVNSASFSEPGAATVAAAVGLGLVVGKVLGITGTTWLAVRAGVGRLPDGATWAMVAGIGAVAGIGFTVSLFVAELAFDSEGLRDAAKIGVLAGSVVAAMVGAAALVGVSRRPPGAGPRVSPLPPGRPG